MNEELITDTLRCPSCHDGTLDASIIEPDGDRIRHAVVACQDCGIWYRLEDGLLELLVPSLRSTTVDNAFRARFALDLPQLHADGEADVEHDHKLGQKSFYDEDADAYAEHMMRLPFWQAFDRTFMQAIRELGHGRGTLLEVGGGSGRLSIPMRGDFDRILSFDISESMVRRAMKRMPIHGEQASHVHYFVADAENIPIRDGVADTAVLSGILHHVARPDAVIRETSRVLKPDGRFIGAENNRTALRPAFDLLMRIRKLWNEKAHPEHFLISGDDLERWFGEAGVSGMSWTSVFLPPHAFNLLPVGLARQVLEASDAAARMIPGLRDQGGLILFSGARRPLVAE